MMGKKWLSLLLALLLVLALGACGKKDDAGDAPEESTGSEESAAPEESQPEESAPEEGTPEGSQSAEEAPEELLPGVELPQAISMTQVLLGMDRVYPYWELEITDQKEIARLMVLLSVEGLTPLTKDQPSIPDGGTPIQFTLEYGDRTDGRWGYFQPAYRIQEEDGRGTIGVGSTTYACPAETCDAILAFLEEKYVRVVG